MHKLLTAFAFLAASALAACGGGGGGGVTGVVMPPGPSQGNLPLSESVAGSMAWVDPSSHKTLYFLDVDTPTGGTCTGACLSQWFVFAPNANAQASGNVTIITRSDGTGKQFAYQGHPLYTFVNDTGPDQTHGDGIPDFGGHWHIARPNASNATPPPGGGGCTGIYC